jgi:hypothetical protein
MNSLRFKKIQFSWCFFVLLSDPPEIEVDTNKVHSGEKKEAHLTCIVRGNPVPKVRIFIFAQLTD